MTPDHERLRELVLSYEDLEGAERRRADDHLAACDGCRALLAEHRRVERLAGAEAALPGMDAEHAFALGLAEQSEAEASLAALRRRLGLEARSRVEHRRAVPRPGVLERARALALGPGAGRRLIAALVPAAAAVVAIVALWPRPGLEQALVRDARATPRSQMRGGAPGWHTGDAFALQIDLAAASRPVVFHLDPAGEISLLYPDDPHPPPPPSPPGRLELPPEEGGVEWRLEGGPGTETFLIAASARADLRLADLIREARAIAEPGREARLHALGALLEKRIGPVRVVEIAHQP